MPRRRRRSHAAGEGLFLTRCPGRLDGDRALHRQGNPNRALSFIDELEDRCATLGKGPGIGTARPETGEGIRMLPHGRYLIFYRQTQRSVRIERVMHSARVIGGDDLETPSDETEQ